MAPKGGNAKKEGGRAKKAENEAKKKEQASAAQEQKEAEKWKDDSAKGKASKEEKEERRKAELARKAENARLLAEEEANAPAKVKAAPKAAKKAVKEPKPAGPGAIAAGGGLSGGADDPSSKAPEYRDSEEVESFAATGIDNALDLLEVVTAKMDKASVGQQAAGIERHPEVRSPSFLLYVFINTFFSFSPATFQGESTRSHVIVFMLILLSPILRVPLRHIKNESSRLLGRRYVVRFQSYLVQFLRLFISPSIPAYACSNTRYVFCSTVSAP